ncbi:phage terminase small subunit P27 family [Nocardiopsis sp. NPDC049922]|uniref:phage terminase small subunit P27 family n=1 Tax=Nocardiopsis sp. NPDC049922 TaxID=3155157 RepID=UPI0033F9346B
MGKRGPRPTPTNVRLLRGDRRDRVNTDEPMPADGLPECPDDASPEVREVWDYTVDQLAAMGTATPADRDALRAYCEAVVTHRKACALLAKSGILIRSAKGGALVRNPVVQVQRDAAATLRGFAQEFGLTPSARSEIRMARETGRGRSADRLLS